jgi:hypothetical protein
VGAYGGDVNRRPAQLVIGALLASLGVTFGIRPAVNLVARLRSPHSYSQYEFAGTWIAGLIAAGAVFGIGFLMSRRHGED